MLYLEIAIVAVLIVINGLLAMSELAIVSSRPARLKMMADRGSGGAARALTLASNPGRFLSAVQIGITLVGVLSGALSGATIGLSFATYLTRQGFSEAAAQAIGVGSVVAVITYASLIIGELVPKRIALRDPERVAAKVAPAMTVLSRIASPLITFLDLSGRAVLWALGLRGEVESQVTAEEVKTIVAEAESAGVLESDERDMISGVMRLGNRSVRGVMTPRTDVDWLDLSAGDAEMRRVLSTTVHSRLPAGEAIESLAGVVLARELLAALIAGQKLDIRAHVRPAPVVTDTTEALDVMPVLRNAQVPMALVHDEYGHFEGVVTPADILEAIVGSLGANIDEEQPIVRRDDGSLLLAGHLPADEMAEHLAIGLPPSRDYQTVAGFVLDQMKRLPAVGESFAAYGWRFEVVDLDGNRIDKVLVSRRA